MTDITPDQRRVLAGLVAIHERREAPSAAAVAIEVGAEPSPVRDVINTLHEKGLIDASLGLTEEGQQALG